MSDDRGKAWRSTAVSRALARRSIGVAVLTAASLALAAAGPAPADDRGWSFRIEGLVSEIDGLQPTVAELRKTVFEGSNVTSQQLESLEVDYGSPLLLRGRVERLRGRWGWGAGFGHLSTDATLARGPLNTDLGQGFALDVASDVFGSLTAPGFPEPGVSFSSRHELELGALDLYGIRLLADNSHGEIGLTFGLRLAELTNARQDLWSLPEVVEVDHRTRAETGLLAGPSLGLFAAARRGSHRFEAALIQAVLAGDTRLDGDQLFTIPLLDATDRLTLGESRSAAIPNAELRVGWLYRLPQGLSLGVSAFASVWWDVPAAPVLNLFDVAPSRISEETLVLSGLLLTIAWE